MRPDGAHEHENGFTFEKDYAAQVLAKREEMFEDAGLEYWKLSAAKVRYHVQFQCIQSTDVVRSAV